MFYLMCIYFSSWLHGWICWTVHDETIFLFINLCEGGNFVPNRGTGDIVRVRMTVMLISLSY